jgi:effector-binding domain-containing protein
MRFILGFSALALFFLACSSENKHEKSADTEVITDTVIEKKEPVYELKTPEKLTDEKGILGVFDVPEMLTMAIMDSVPLSKIPLKMAKSYGFIQNDIKNVKAEMNGAPGVIYYNNDTANFVFECVIPIAEIPKKQPKYSRIVLLEPSRMLIYNYYGTYTGLNLAYLELINYSVKNKMKQTGPMREFYITDPGIVKDTAKWFTRIMLPVK